MAIDNQTPISIDYTSRDYYALRNDLINRVSLRVNSQERTLSGANKYAWNPQDPADFGVAMVEAFAHIGDIANYYIDRVANESYLATAVQRQNLINIASMYGYKPVGWRAAVVDVNVSNSYSSDKVIPQGSVVATTVVTQTATSQAVVDEYFTVTEDVFIGAAVGGVATVTSTLLSHGRNVSSLDKNKALGTDPNDIPGELLGYSTGYANQTFKLDSTQVVDGSVVVYVRNGDYYIEWQQVDSLSDYAASDAVYSVTYDANNNVYINFGNNINGAIPVTGDAIKATYVVGGGLNGNIDGGQTFRLVYVPANSLIYLSDISALSIINLSSSKGYGGEEPESNSSIRRNAPAANKVSTRAVSLIDFENLALMVPGVGKTAAYASSPTSVVLYMGPTTSDSSSDYYPGYTSTAQTATTGIWNTTQSAVVNYLAGKTQIGTTVTVLPPVYSLVDISVEYVKEAAYRDADITTAIKNSIVLGFGYNYIDFDATLRPEKIEQSLATINGVDSIKVLSFNRHGSSGRVALTPAQGELFVFTDGNTTGKIYPIASLSNLIVTIANGTMPTFDVLTSSYAFTTTSSTMTFTATAANTLSGFASTLAYKFTNGSGSVTTGSLTSGTASASLTLTTGTNTIAVSVTSADGAVTNTYSIIVTK